MAFLRHIETLVPEHGYRQERIGKILGQRSGSDRTKRYIRSVYGESAIEKRHCIVPDFEEGFSGPSLYVDADGSPKEPSTGERNDAYVAEARKMTPEIARRSVAACEGVEAKNITHVITVSCTGFFNPGPDLLVIEALGLAPTTQRYHLGFMGCYAAFPALKMAAQFCDLDESANVLIVCLEFCSLHLQNKNDLDTIVANSVFADGAAAAIVSGQAPPTGVRGYDLLRFASSLVPEGADDMAWDIGDHGFNIVLSKYVARIIGSGIKELIDEVFAGSGMTPEEIAKWAVHPGGRAILDKVGESLELAPDQLAASREVLAQYGNMSSATVLFVLAEVLREADTKPGDSICAMAFGPGLTIETGVFKVV
ncbi:MAG: type III polyketide synthase [Verrucomicrobiales bacterium]|nr:type III polyketide synthase [Verrucomicrobiales bacterium]